MQQNIYDTNDEFDFSKINISKPITISSGQFMLKFSVGESPLYVNPPKCTLKTLATKGGKRIHCDFIFSQENDQFIRWIENLEKLAQDKIYDNRGQWFETELEKEDIENYFTSPLKIYKSGKYYTLRTNLPTLQQQQKQSFKIYDENENEIQFDAITENMNIMCVLDIQGIRCSSSSFQIDLLVKQMMVLQPVDLFQKCILKKKIEPAKSIIMPILDVQETKQEIEEIPIEIPIVEEPIEKKPTLEEMEESHVTLPTVLVETENKEKTDELCEVDFDLNDMDEADSITIKQRKDTYYEMYTEARRKAKIARDLALSAYLEARRIKNTYMLEDILDSSDESDIDELEELEEE
jgi:hypothetical protein